MTDRDLIITGTVAQNKKARRDYEISDSFEAGLVLFGSEVKSLRHGYGDIKESYASSEDDGIYLVNSYIPVYSSAINYGHDPRRKRKVLLHQKEIIKLDIEVSRKGMTLIPLSLYFNSKGIAKIKLGIAKGRTKIDKREVIKKREWERSKSRILKNKI